MGGDNQCRVCTKECCQQHIEQKLDSGTVQLTSEFVTGPCFGIYARSLKVVLQLYG